MKAYCFWWHKKARVAGVSRTGDYEGVLLLVGYGCSYVGSYKGRA